eukprot:11588204-Heterocapsa_arctica.AAC.1
MPPFSLSFYMPTLFLTVLRTSPSGPPSGASPLCSSPTRRHSMTYPSWVAIAQVGAASRMRPRHGLPRSRFLCWNCAEYPRKVSSPS